LRKDALSITAIAFGNSIVDRGNKEIERAQNPFYGQAF